MTPSRLTVKHEHNGRTCAFEVDYTPSTPGRWNPYDGGEPPDGGECDLISGVYLDGAKEPVDLEEITEEEHEEIWEKADEESIERSYPDEK